jgi:small multidrug resistance pump
MVTLGDSPVDASETVAMPANLYLVIAIIAEVIATSALKASDGFSRPWFAALAFVGYLIAFIGLAFALRQIPLGVAYAIWSGVGIALLAIIGRVVYRQQLSITEIVGILLIVSGVAIIQWGSRQLHIY